MSKQLYIFSCEVLFKGKCKTFFNKEKEVSASKYLAMKSIISDEKSVLSDIEEYIKTYFHDELEKNENNEATAIINEKSLYSLVKFDKIEDLIMTDCEYRPATVEECIKALTPIQFKNLYGNIIIGGDLHD
jgi:hypothetical protein